MKIDNPLIVLLELSVTPHLRNLIQRSEHFHLTDNGDQADIIIFENDKPAYIRQTAEYKIWPGKCIVVSECDNPSYFLPACYASNEICWLSRGRAKTIPYIISQFGFPNPYIKDIGTDTSARYLYAFRGGATSWVRKKIFRNAPKHPDVLIEDSNDYRHWNFENSYAREKLNSQKEYADILEHSSFFLCPRGVGVSSIRLYEVMQAGRVPVIISDRWSPIPDIKWPEFSIRLPERDLLKIDSVIRENKHRAYQLGIKAKQIWMEYCSPGNDTLFLANCIHRIQADRVEQREKLIRLIFPLFEIKRNLRENLRSTLRAIILRGFEVSGMKFPYSLNRPIK